MKTPASLALLAAISALSGSALAQTVYTFTGALDSNWASSGNWQNGSVAPTNGTFSNRRVNLNGATLVYSAAQGTTAYNNTGTARALVVSSGSITFSGGSFTSNNPTLSSEDVVGNATNAVSTLSVNGGSYTSNALTMNFSGGGATTNLNVQNGSASIGTLKVQALTGSTSTVNLDGGTLATNSLTGTGTGTKTINFNGGTLRTNAALTVSGFNNVFVKAGGALVDTNGFNSTVSQALVTDAVSTGGGLTKSGLGTLTLAGANTYTGATRVDAGTLALGAAGSLAASAGVELAAGATFDTSAQSFAMSDGQTFTFELDGAGSGSSGLLEAASLDIGSASVSFNVTGGSLDDDAYVLANYTSIGGTSFGTVANLPSGYVLDYNYLGANQIALVATAIPEPSAFATFAGAAGLMTGLVRRRRRG